MPVATYYRNNIVNKGGTVCEVNVRMNQPKLFLLKTSCNLTYS